MPPASLGELPRSARGSDPGFFQITGSALSPLSLLVPHLPLVLQVTKYLMLKTTYSYLSSHFACEACFLLYSLGRIHGHNIS